MPLPSSALYPSVLPTSSFRIGRDRTGHWLAIETHGLGGGIFVTQAAAIRYAESITGRHAGAIVITSDVMELHQAASDTSASPRFFRSAAADGARPRKAANA